MDKLQHALRSGLTTTSEGVLPTRGWWSFLICFPRMALFFFWCHRQRESEFSGCWCACVYESKTDSNRSVALPGNPGLIPASFCCQRGGKKKRTEDLINTAADLIYSLSPTIKMRNQAGCRHTHARKRASVQRAHIIVYSAWVHPQLGSQGEKE